MSIPMKRIAKNLGRSEGTARQRLHLLGYKVPKEIADKFRMLSRFPKGHKPANKGKKQTEFMSTESIERSKATRFKKGQRPHNTKERDGEISIRRDKSGYDYKYIRVSLGEWELYHRVVWQKHNGEIPEGGIISFKDGNSLNCSIENLKLLSLEENMKRNSGSINLTDGMVATYMATKSRKVNHELRNKLKEHPELIELKRNQLKLARAIKYKQDDKI